MASGIPRPNPNVDLRQLNLSPAEGFVLSRIDGNTSVEALIQLVGIPGERVRDMLARFVREGVLALDGVSPAEPEPEHATGSHRALFETKLRRLDEADRVGLAGQAAEPELSALCFDPLPRVILRLLENAKLTLAHARLIAAHHPDPRGLDALASRAEFFRDGQVQRALLRNAQFSEATLKRMLSGRRMLEIYKVGISREATERARRSAMQLLRQRFATGAAEERVEVILQTEGRALGGLAGIPVDGRTAALLCARPFHSTMLIQNIARWAAAPPALIAHLLKQPMVRRQPQLRALLTRHPNAPSDAR